MNPTNQSPQLLAEALARKCAESLYGTAANNFDAQQILQSIPLVELLECVSALQGMSEMCDNYFESKDLVCARDKEIWAQHTKALSSPKLNQLLGEQK